MKDCNRHINCDHQGQETYFTGEFTDIHFFTKQKIIVLINN